MNCMGLWALHHERRWEWQVAHGYPFNAVLASLFLTTLGCLGVD